MAFVSRAPDGDITRSSKNWLKIPSVVRVETGVDVNVDLSTQTVVAGSDADDCESAPTNQHDPAMPMDVDDLEKGMGVAWDFDYYGVLRGFIQKSEECGEDSSFVLKFTNGRRLKMGESKAKEARTLFQQELSKLTSIGMTLKAASFSQETQNVELAWQTKGSPILSTEEDEDPINLEQRFETTFSGEIPACIVGLEMPITEKKWEGKWLPIIEKIARRMMEQSVESTRQLYNLSKNEAHIEGHAGELSTSSPPKKTRTF